MAASQSDGEASSKGVLKHRSNTSSFFWKRGSDHETREMSSGTKKEMFCRGGATPEFSKLSACTQSWREEAGSRRASASFEVACMR